jgi:hypothetical protein
MYRADGWAVCNALALSVLDVVYEFRNLGWLVN